MGDLMELPKYAEIMNIERYAIFKEKSNQGEIDESKGKFYIEEKVDGSQFRFGIDGDGNFMAGSKNVNYSNENQPERSFKQICEVMEKKLKLINEFRVLEPNDFIVFYAEYLRSEKHNALKYDRVPKGNLYLFDIAINGVYQPIDYIKDWAKVLEIEPVNVYDISDKLPEYNSISEKLKTWNSCLGGINPEGVVIKNYDITIMDNYRKVETPLMIKVVRDGFKEILKKDWKKREGKSANDIIGRIIDQVNKNAVWDKAIFRLRDEGKLTGKMQDMKLLIEAVNDDILKEWQEVIYKELYSSFERDIEKAFAKGLAEYYKKKIYDELKDKIGDK